MTRTKRRIKPKFPSNTGRCSPIVKIARQKISSYLPSKGRKHRRGDRTGRSPGLRNRFGLPNSPGEAPSGRDSHPRDRSWLQLLKCSLSLNCTSPSVKRPTLVHTISSIVTFSPNKPSQVRTSHYTRIWLGENHHYFLLT